VSQSALFDHEAAPPGYHVPRREDAAPVGDAVCARTSHFAMVTRGPVTSLTCLRCLVATYYEGYPQGEPEAMSERRHVGCWA